MTKALVLATIIFIEILAGAELDLFVPSFPELQAQFDLTPFWVEALLSVNFAGLCVSLFFIGALADRYGRKPVIVIGLIIFIVGSVMCLFASSYLYLLLGRFLQGIGIAAPGTICFLIIADSYPIKEQQYMLAMLNGVINASVGAAPVLGSYITLYFHWRGNFTALLVIGILSLIMTLSFLPAHQTPGHKETLSLKGYLPIFQSKPLLLLMTSLVFLFAPYWVFVGMSPLLYIKNLGVSLAHFGYYQGVFCVVFALGSVLFGLIMSKFDQKKILYTGCCILVASLLCIGYVTFFDISNPLIITLAFLVFVIGQIIPSAILYPICLNLLPTMKGRVSSLMQGFKLILTAGGLQLAGYFYTGTFQHIGIILFMMVVVGVLTLLWVIKTFENFEL